MFQGRSRELPEYTMSIEQDATGRWTAAAGGLTTAADGYTAARDALKDALYARDSAEPLMRRNRTEVPIPPAAQRTPERLMELLTQEIPSQVDRHLQALQKARRQDETGDKPCAVTAWCIDAAHTIVSNRAAPWNTDAEPDFIPWTKPDPRAGDDFFLTCWSPHELDELPELKQAADVPRTILGILQALPPNERPQAWAEMTSATHGPDLDRAMARWWHMAMNMGTAAVEMILARSEERLAAGKRGTPSTDIPSSRALDDLLTDLTPEEKAAWDEQHARTQRIQTNKRQAREDAYIADLERLLRDGQQQRDERDEHHEYCEIVNAVRSRVTPPAYQYPIEGNLFTQLRDGQPITLHLPARPWRRIDADEGFHFAFTHGRDVQLARVTQVRTYHSVAAFDAAGASGDAPDTEPRTRGELESYTTDEGGIITLTIAPVDPRTWRPASLGTPRR